MRTFVIVLAACASTPAPAPSSPPPTRSEGDARQQAIAAAGRAILGEQELKAPAFDIFGAEDPQAALDRAEVSGALSRETVAIAMKSVEHAILDCLKPTVAHGAFAVSFVIGVDGGAAVIRVVGADDMRGHCASRTIEAWRFETGTGETFVRYSFAWGEAD